MKENAVKVKFVYNMEQFNRFKMADIRNNSQFYDFTMQFLLNLVDDWYLC